MKRFRTEADAVAWLETVAYPHGYTELRAVNDNAVRGFGWVVYLPSGCEYLARCEHLAS